MWARELQRVFVFVFVFVFVLVFVFVFEEDDEEKVRKTLARDWQCLLRSR